ncbi:uncharacterized protein BDW70DRAFT_158039 [Aspergillus foveolatus]|uniref:uncharacterized protein n=1 Tax=Aspergillus foveolatus TaxID=210207 RepID=UPI003CCCF9D4
MYAHRDSLAHLLHSSNPCPVWGARRIAHLRSFNYVKSGSSRSEHKRLRLAALLVDAGFRNGPQTPSYPSTPNSLAIPLSPVVYSLLHCCAESAQTVLQTLRTLVDSDRIEAFLPFQIEYAIASALLLGIFGVIAPTLAPEQTWLETADS